jgi:hypothetical protein
VLDEEERAAARDDAQAPAFALEGRVETLGTA